MARININDLTKKELDSYFGGKLCGYFYADSVKKHKEFLPHSDGDFPEEIIRKQRPNEAELIFKFRAEIWQPITKPSFTCVVSSLSKIRRSSDWAITYPKEVFGKIVEGETLEEYCEKNYPYFTSITNWVFSVLLKQYLVDPNAVVLVLPLTTDDLEETEYLKPFTYIYNSCDVIDYEAEQFAILNISGGCIYYDKKGNIKQGKSFYLLDTMTIVRYDQIDDKGNMSITWTYEHALNWLPVFKLGGIICKTSNNDFLYESRINGVLPNLNEAIAEYTDLQAGKRLHMYLERWDFTQHECPQCKGTGMMVNTNYRPGDDLISPKIKCTNCVNGYVAPSPYSRLVIKPSEVGQNPIPNPPSGYIEKDVEIINIMDASVDKQIYKALSAINFQFLAQTPLNQSGDAKEVDKEELNNTVHSIAEDIIALMDKLYKTIAYYRYRITYTQAEINKMLPTIPVPEHFDLISSQYMQDEIGKARTAKINPLLISEMEVEYSSKRFPENEEVNDLIRLINNLDPLPGSTIDEKLAMSSNGTITKENNIISDNIVSFLKRALYENDNFAQLDMAKQKEILNGYATEQIQAGQQQYVEPDTGNNASQNDNANQDINNNQQDQQQMQ